MAAKRLNLVKVDAKQDKFRKTYTFLSTQKTILAKKPGENGFLSRFCRNRQASVSCDRVIIRA
jgi:hypothetical protein